jgi:parvulin-like peptidyl-prolyl isomerase
MRFARHTVVIVLVALALIGGAGCSRTAPPAPYVVARVDRDELAYMDFETYLQDNSLAGEAALSSEVLSGLFDQFVDEALVLRLATDRKPDEALESPQLALETLLDEMTRDQVTESDLIERFRKDSEETSREETVVLEQILVEDRVDAESALEAIEDGMSFEDAARTYSQGPVAALGGLQGELGRSDLPPALAEVVFGLEAGEVSEIIAADYGFHLFRVVERRAATAPALDDVRPRLEARLRSEARARALARLVEEGRRSYNVVVYVRNLPFNYAGIYK